MKLLHLIRIYSACKFNRFFPDFPMGPKRPEKTELSGALAIVNAIYDAIGVDFMELPITPEKILDALEAKEKEE